MAHALAEEHIVVTHEVAAPSSKMKVPDSCIGLGVTYMTPYEMLREEQPRFVLRD